MAEISNKIVARKRVIILQGLVILASLIFTCSSILTKKDKKTGKRDIPVSGMSILSSATVFCVPSLIWLGKRYMMLANK